MIDIASINTNMTAAAAGLLEALSPEQRKKTALSYDDEKERRTWYYTPTPRNGLALVEMTPRQRQKVMRLMATGLTEAGYNYASVVMGLENIVDYRQGFSDRTYGNLPGTRQRDPENYCVAVFGAPGDKAGWQWRIGGHHLSLSYTLHDGAISPTPAFFGAEPARSPMPGGVFLRPLAAEEDSARYLLSILRPDQRGQAVISAVAPTDIVQTNRPKIEDGAYVPVGGTGPGGQDLRDRMGLTPELDEKLRYSLKAKGLPFEAMDTAQRAALARIIRVYFDHLPEAIIAQYAAVWTPENLTDTAFAWAGPDTVGGPHYYRVQSERLLIEYDCTQNEANHTHSVVRDPQGDFGDDLLARHYATAPAGHGHGHAASMPKL